MTNGTSQGLFIVVAIIIFGIFIGLTYTLFGSEGLSNDLKGIFDNALEDALTTLDSSDVAKKDYTWNEVYSEENIEFKLLEKQTAYDLKPTLPFKMLDYEQDKTFKVSFDITLNSGTLNSIGGHNHMSANQMLLINGKRVQGKYQGGYDLAWNNGADLDISIGETVHIDLVFITDRFNNPIDGNTNMYFSIEPNRQHKDGSSFLLKEPFNATVTNLKVSEGTENGIE